MSLFDVNAKIVNVSFVGKPNIHALVPNVKTYAYFTDLDLKVGDSVVVASKFSNDSNKHTVFKVGEDYFYLAIAVVASIGDTVEGIEKVREWIISKVDISEFIDRKEKQAKKDLLKARILRVRQEMIENMALDDLAKSHPGLQSMIEEFNKL